MEISEGELVQMKIEEEAMFHEIIHNEIQIELVKEEPRDPVFFIKCEMCNENSDNEAECVHIKNNKLLDLDQDNKLRVPSLHPAAAMHINNIFEEDEKLKVKNTESSSSQREEDSIMKLTEAEVTVKEEEYLDDHEYFSTDTYLVKCEIGQVKIEEDETSLSSDLLAKDEDSNEGNHPGSSKESQKDFRKQVKDTNENTFQCQVCSKMFSIRSHLARHNLTHTKEKPFHCQVCSKSFTDSSDHVRHERIHTGEKPFNCIVCSKSFSQSNDLVRHKRIHSGEKPFNCKVCAKSFGTRGDLVRHGRTHTGEKPFSCKVCSKSFSQSNDLVRHRKIHTGEKPFNCKVCSKSFGTRGDLVRHTRTHTGEKPFSCKV